MIRLARHALDHPWRWILGVLATTLIAASGIARLEVRTEGAAIRPAGHPIVRQAEIDRLRFQDPRQAILLVAAREAGPAVATPEGFRYLRDLQDGLRRLASVRADAIVSVAALPRLVDGLAGISLGTYLDDVPDDPATFGELLATVRERVPTEGLLLSADGRRAAFYVPLIEDAPIRPAIGELDGFVAGRRDGPFTLRLTGPEVAETTLGQRVLRDLSVLIPAMLGLIVVLLLATLRSPGAVIVTLAEVGVVLALVLGGMGWAGVPVTLVTTILPVVLMAMAITDEIHLLERVQGGSGALRERVGTAVTEVGRPIVVTSVTTAVGFLSFLSASVTPLRQFGLFTALGILVAMLLSFCWVPALIVTLPERWFRRWGEPGDPGAAPRRWWVARHPTVASIVGLAIVLLAAPGLTRLRVQDAWVDNFDPASDLVVADADLNASFWGSYRHDVVLEAGPGFFYTPEGAGLVEAVEAVARKAPGVGGVLSYLAPLGDAARTLDEDRPLSQLSHDIVADLATVAEMSASRSTLRQLLTERGDAVRVRLFVNSPDYARARAVEAHLQAGLAPVLDGFDVRWRSSGDLPVATTVVDSIVGNQLRSIGWALLAVAVALWLFGGGAPALLALVPVMAAAVILCGVMGYAGLGLGIATSTFTSLTIGVGVDFGVHFGHRYRSERGAGRSHERALLATRGNTGRALRWNVTVLALGFAVLILSSLQPNRDLGLLLAAAMVTCYGATLLFLPRLLGALVPAVIVALCASAPAAAAECPAVEVPEARQLMHGLEREIRDEARIVRMQISTAYSRRHRLWRHFQERTDDKTLWGVFDGDPATTRIVFVFSGPGRLAGTTLLLHDAADPAVEDASWLYLRSFNRITELGPRTGKLLVPGTALSYEDSRGFIPQDKYTFSFVEGDDARPGGRRVLACPRSEAIAENLGYSALIIEVDRRRELVRQIEYRDLGGKPLKRYELASEVRPARRWLPGQVRLVQLLDGYTTTIDYENWLPVEAPPAVLFEPALERGSFIARLQPWLGKVGLSDRIDPEIEAAEARVRAYDEARRKEREARARAKGAAPSGR